MNRRSFLVGSGSILTSAFVDKANWFLRNKNSVVPFAEAKENAETLYFVDLGHQNFDLRLGTPEYGLPDLTFRQWLEKYEYPLNFGHQGGEGFNKDSFEKLMGWHDVETDQLDEIAPFELYHKKWELTDCFGEYDYRQNVIQVQHDLCGQEMANTIFHEVMHAAVQVAGLNQEKQALEKPEFEEAVVNQLTNVMMGVFRDNDWMIDMLKTQLEDSEDAD